MVLPDFRVHGAGVKRATGRRCRIGKHRCGWLHMPMRGVMVMVRMVHSHWRAGCMLIANSISVRRVVMGVLVHGQFFLWLSHIPVWRRSPTMAMMTTMVAMHQVH